MYLSDSPTNPIPGVLLLTIYPKMIFDVTALPVQYPVFLLRHFIRPAKAHQGMGPQNFVSSNKVKAMR